MDAALPFPHIAVQPRSRCQYIQYDVAPVRSEDDIIHTPAMVYHLLVLPTLGTSYRALYQSRLSPFQPARKEFEKEDDNCSTACIAIHTSLSAMF